MKRMAIDREKKAFLEKQKAKQKLAEQAKMKTSGTKEVTAPKAAPPKASSVRKSKSLTKPLEKQKVEVQSQFISVRTVRKVEQPPRVAVRKVKSSPKADAAKKGVTKSSLLRMSEKLKKAELSRESSRIKSAEALPKVKKPTTASQRTSPVESPSKMLQTVDVSPKGVKWSEVLPKTAKIGETSKETSKSEGDRPQAVARSPSTDDVTTARERSVRGARSPSTREVSTARERSLREARSPSTREVTTAREHSPMKSPAISPPSDTPSDRLTWKEADPSELTSVKESPSMTETAVELSVRRVSSLPAIHAYPSEETTNASLQICLCSA
ncbi:hypothetical protein COOONC_24769 [Cooperia oncophora]